MNCSSINTVYEEAVGRAGSWARLCDGCSVLPGVVYCHADSAYLCVSCDVWIHSANRLASRHERVLLSEAYRHAPAVLECRAGADDAALSAAYEAQVHYANQLARMHQCVPVLSHPAPAIPASSLLAETAATTTILRCKQEEASWLLLSKDSAYHNCSSSTYFREVDEYFDLAGYNSYYDNSHMTDNRAQYVMQEQQQHLQQMQEGSECVVPSHSATVGAGQAASVTAGVINNIISFSTIEAAIVPGKTEIDMPHSSILTPAGASSVISGAALEMPLHLSSTDREARVLRYKEKKKIRKFEKTTRYAARKARAETRPRIKGRFAKRSDAEEIELDQMFSAAALSDSSYSTVPWF